ncbi:MAG: hypothetical protein AAGL69_07420 [Pseudomonadota bacterium]
MTPNFENYSLEELYEALDTIDRFKYPDRLRRIELLIQERAEAYRTGGFVNAGEARAAGILAINARRLTSKTVFKTVFFALLIVFVILTLLIAIAAGLGAQVMQVNGAYVTGVKGALVTLGLGLAFSLINVIVLSLLACLGARLHALISDVQVELVMEHQRDSVPSD